MDADVDERVMNGANIRSNLRTVRPLGWSGVEKPISLEGFAVFIEHPLVYALIYANTKMTIKGTAVR